MNLEALDHALKRGLHGTYIHMDPLKALKGLTPETASKIPKKGTHSCWHILHHIVYWQELMLAALKNESVSWPKNNDESWPSAEMLDITDNWTELVKKFENGLNEAEHLTSKIESTEDLPAWPKVSPVAAFLVFLQHNSFHIGEIVATRQALGIWPPPEYKPTF
jgi:uncharacterized damage-inducible protein DinB